MDHETNKQEPSSKEGGEVKVGDKVWVLCEVLEPEHRGCVKCANHNYVLHPYVDEIRPVEPANHPEIPDSSIEGMREAFEADLIQRHGWNQSYFGRNENRYFDSSVEMTWQAYQAGAKHSDSSGGWEPTKDEIEYATDRCGVPASDPINPGHYKHLPAEAINIIEAAIAKAPSNQYAFLQGQVIKYLLRCWSKKGIEDLRKAKWYLDRLVSGFDDLLAEVSGANDGPTRKRYRTPILADLANGPIFCESRDHENHDWKTRMLADILDGPGYPFLCLNAGANNALRYAQCRIEVGE